MSAWMSSVNKVANAARGTASAAAHRQASALQAEATRQVVDFWTGKTAIARAPKKRR